MSESRMTTVTEVNELTPLEEAMRPGPCLRKDNAEAAVAIFIFLALATFVGSLLTLIVIWHDGWWDYLYWPNGDATFSLVALIIFPLMTVIFLVCGALPVWLCKRYCVSWTEMDGTRRAACLLHSYRFLTHGSHRPATQGPIRPVHRAWLRPRCPCQRWTR